MLALCSMLSGTYYAHNSASIIDGSLATELALKNQQLTKLLAETEARETELALENQQLTESLAVTEEKMTKLVLECEQLRKHF